MTAFAAALLLQRLREQAELLSYSERDERGLRVATRWEERTAEDQARWVERVRSNYIHSIHSIH